jgi:hypothetical protein
MNPATSVRQRDFVTILFAKDMTLFAIKACLGVSEFLPQAKRAIAYVVPRKRVSGKCPLFERDISPPSKHYVRRTRSVVIAHHR